MSSYTYTEPVVRCDAPDCQERLFGSHVDRDSAAAVRRVAKARGWLVDRPGHGRRLDYCPDHATELANRKDDDDRQT